MASHEYRWRTGSIIHLKARRVLKRGDAAAAATANSDEDDDDDDDDEENNKKQNSAADLSSCFDFVFTICFQRVNS